MEDGRLIRKWIAKQIARYEHAARRAQLPIWLVIAINTFLEVVWDTVSLEIVLFLYAVGIIAAVIIGYISHKLRVGSGIVMQQFDIESRELYDVQAQVIAGRFTFEEIGRRSDEIVSSSTRAKELKVK